MKAARILCAACILCAVKDKRCAYKRKDNNSFFSHRIQAQVSEGIPNFEAGILSEGGFARSMRSLASLRIKASHTSREALLVVSFKKTRKISKAYLSFLFEANLLGFLRDTKTAVCANSILNFLYPLKKPRIF